MKLAKYISVISISFFKFIGGPLTGIALQLRWFETIICSVVGMMLAVVMLLFFQTVLSKFINKENSKRKFSKLSRFAIKIRNNFGLKGITALTPILFSPIGGTLLALAFRYNKWEIFYYMFFSSTFWAIVETFSLHNFQEFLKSW